MGDWLVTRAPGGKSIVHVDWCATCTLRNVTLGNAGFGAFFETRGPGGNRYLHCAVAPGPRPRGATEEELVGCGADGFHSTGAGVGPDLEDCTFTGVFLDDCIAIHGSFLPVLSASGATLILQARPVDCPVVGATLRIADTRGFFAQARCLAVQALPGQGVQVTLDQKLDHFVDRSHPDDPRQGAKASDPARCGRGYKILRCRLGNTRSRGILVKADDGLIDHCRIEGCGMSGVSIGPAFWWGEAGYAWNVTISNNIFLDCARNNGDPSSIFVHGDGAIGNRNISIDHNTFTDCSGQYVMRIEDADGVRITRNQIDGSFRRPAKLPGNVFWLNESRHIELLGNAVTHQGSHAGAILGFAPGMNEKEVSVDHAAGINPSTPHLP